MARTKFVVITSINPPSEAVHRFSRWTGWQVVVVGDRKSPPAWCCDGVTFLDIEEQHDLFGALSRRIPENTYTRKMLGYAYAIRHGAEAIFESDDDNLPYETARCEVEALLASPGGAGARRVGSDIGWVNIYHSFGAPECWPRGYPLQLVKDPGSRGRPGTDAKPWGVVQFLADEDPDVDAVYRMLGGAPAYFSRERRYLLDEGSYCPMNSQATLWLPEAFPLLFLPVGVPDRVTDILRGYIALACLWKIGRSALYASPVVYQERNVHNLFNDFRQELPLYVNAQNWCERLLEVRAGGAGEAYLACLEMLAATGAIPRDNTALYPLFLETAGLLHAAAERRAPHTEGPYADASL